jgi:hypothetical protein
MVYNHYRPIHPFLDGALAAPIAVLLTHILTSAKPGQGATGKTCMADVILGHFSHTFSRVFIHSWNILFAWTTPEPPEHGLA